MAGFARCEFGQRNLALSTRSKSCLEPYIDFHLLVQVVLHDETVRQANSMRLHGMASHVGIVTNIGVVEIGDLLGRRPIESRRARQRREIVARHRDHLLRLELLYSVVSKVVGKCML